MLKLRIRFTHTQDALIRNQKYGKTPSPSRVHIQTFDGQSLYLSSSPLIDFPFNMRNIEGKFDSKTTMYLSHIHANALKQTLRYMLKGINRQDLFYLSNNMLMINEAVANEMRQLVPIKGIIIEIHYCIIKELTGNNEYSFYEGIRIVNPLNQTMAELTIDEIDSLIDILDSLKPGVLATIATGLALDLLKTPNEVINALHIPREQIISS